MSHKTNLTLAVALTLLLSGCSGKKLAVRSVGYQSVRTDFRQESTIPPEAKIAVMYVIETDGSINAVVKNMTTEIMTIDQTKSFFINTDRSSTSYYDPTVKTTSNSSYSSGTEGLAFNLGGIANGLGIGGMLGSMMNATTLSGAETAGNINTVTTYLRDMPEVSIGPLGSGVMSKVFKIKGVGSEALAAMPVGKGEWSDADSPGRFSVCISYRIGEKGELHKLVTNFYVNASIVAGVSKGRVNNAFREIYSIKPDALSEPAYIICMSSNLPAEDNVYDRLSRGALVDYQ